MEGKNIILTGFMGTGKSAVGEILARRLKRIFIDTDAVIEEKTGMSIADIFKNYGEEYFRNRESEVIESLRSYPSGSLVVASGGGAVIREKNRQLLRENAVIILLEASPRAIRRRVKKTGQRPLLADTCSVGEIRARLSEREQFYCFHDLGIDTTGRRPNRIAEGIITLLHSGEGLN